MFVNSTFKPTIDTVMFNTGHEVFVGVGVFVGVCVLVGVKVGVSVCVGVFVGVGLAQTPSTQIPFKTIEKRPLSTLGVSS